jgi:radical SAM protein with 4Fe4S-binding SPASM domain
MRNDLLDQLHILSWNVTRRCNLSCQHCYLPAVASKKGSAIPSSELTTREALQFIDQLAQVNPEAMLILTGGEPLLREDIFELSSHAYQKGMLVVMGTNGLLINDATARTLKQNGVSGVSISLDSATPEVHDSVRSHDGAWEGAVAAVRSCRSADLSVQINTVVTSRNYDAIPEIITLSQTLGATVFSPFFLVCTGNGEKMTDISPLQYEMLLSRIAQTGGKHQDVMVRSRCAPTIRRILYDMDPASILLKMDSGRCLAGISYCRVSPEGEVTPCPYMPVSAGNIRERPFKDIWEHSGLLKALKNPDLKGKCRDCSYRKLCGGCRARAFAACGDYLAEDPWCSHIPQKGTVIEPPSFNGAFRDTSTAEASAGTAPFWSREAEERLKRVPSFVRGMVRRAVERYARENDRREITPAVMEEVKQRSGMGGMSGHR